MQINEAKYLEEFILKGQILEFSVQKNMGVISAADDNRYTFVGSEWRGDNFPARGTFVDFGVKENNAVDVFLGLEGSSSKSKAAATLWGAFLGGFGAHKFYMGSWGWGIVYLLTFWLYIPFIVSMVEWIRYVCMKDVEFDMKAQEFRESGPFGFFW